MVWKYVYCKRAPASGKPFVCPEEGMVQGWSSGRCGFDARSHVPYSLLAPRIDPEYKVVRIGSMWPDPEFFSELLIAPHDQEVFQISLRFTKLIDVDLEGGHLALHSCIFQIQKTDSHPLADQADHEKQSDQAKSERQQPELLFREGCCNVSHDDLPTNSFFVGQNLLTKKLGCN